MCFSASASFAASGVLAATGAITLTKVKYKREIPLALVPLLFGIQQFIEGLQWLSDKPSCTSTVLGYAFLSFAFFVWPVFIPFAAMMVEDHPLRRNLLRVFLGIGIAVEFALFLLVIKNPLLVGVTNNSISYNIAIPTAVGIVPYVLATCGSCIASSHRIIRWLGVGIFLSLGIAWWAASATFGSVWCFFAAVLSVIVYFYFRAVRTKP